MDTYFKVMEENANEIVVVKVYAGFCRACKAFDRKYRALALDYEEAGANIKFFEMDWMQTRDLCKSLQVRMVDRRPDRCRADRPTDRPGIFCLVLFSSFRTNMSL